MLGKGGKSLGKSLSQAIDWDTLVMYHDQGHDLEELLGYEQRYTDRQLIGTGAIKEVYQCYDESLKKHVALAQVKEGREKEYDTQLLREAWITTKLDHPNIISIHDIGLDQRGRVYFTMDLKSGKSFQELVKDEEERRSWLASFLKVCLLYTSPSPRDA